MRRKLFFIVTVVLLCLTVRAQDRLYICHHDSCEVYQTVHINSIILQDDSLCVDGQPPYSVHQVDSMTFTCPANLIMEKRGWWGDIQEGELKFLAVLTEKHPNSTFDYHVRFTITVRDSICQTAVCELLFDEEWQRLFFYGMEPEESTVDSAGDPYIYVKETLTGPRRFEVWVMGDPVLPEDCIWEIVSDGLVLRSDCSVFLAGRPMSEVKQIVEAWLFQPLVKIENPYNHEDND